MVSEIDGWSPLLFACLRNNINIVDILLQHGANPFHVSNNGMFSCPSLAEQHKNEKLNLVLKVATLQRSIIGNKLIEHSHDGDLTEIILLFKKPYFDINFVNENSWTGKLIQIKM